MNGLARSLRPGSVESAPRLSVEDLDPNAQRYRVIVVGEPAPDRGDRANDLPPGSRVSMEWRFLTLPEADQRHRTVRLFEESFDDDDGWVEVERLDSP